MKTITQEIIKLRKSGLTYKEIQKKLNCSKGVISYACNKYIVNNEEISNKHFKESLKLEPHKQSLIKARRAAKEYYKKQESEKIHFYIKKLKSYNNQSFIYYISGLYDGEGTHSAKHAFDLSNTDPKIMTSFKKICRRCIR